jgi:hypothetical protein
VLSLDSGLPSIFFGRRGALCGDAPRGSGRDGVCIVGVCGCICKPLRWERAEGLKYPQLGQTYSIQQKMTTVIIDAGYKKQRIVRTCVFPHVFFRESIVGETLLANKGIA